MTIPAPFISMPMAIAPEWLDYNGHFNMAYYGVLFDRAAEEQFGIFGFGPDYVKATNNSYFTLETHTSYLREIAPTDTVVVETLILAHDLKRVHYVQSMKHADDGWVACVMEVMVSHVDLTLKKTSAMPEQVLAKIAEAAAAHKAVPVPPQVGHRIGLPAAR